MSKVMPFLLPLFRSILFIIVGFLFIVLTNQTLEQASNWWSVICTFCNIITIIVLMVILKKEGTSYKQLISSKMNFKYTISIILWMLILGIGGMTIFGFIIYGYLPVTMIQPIPVWVAVINVVLLPLTIVFAEFPLYFGYSLIKINKIAKNKLLTIGYPMFFYALQHSFMPLLFDWKHILFRFLSFLPLILLLGISYYKKRELKPIMIGHAILDFATASQILMTSIFPVIFEVMQNH